MTLVWSSLAVERLHEIAQYIFQDNEETAVQWLDAVLEQVPQLIDCPQIGRVVPETNREDIRELLYKNYRIIYWLDGEVVNLLTIRHGKQILPLEDLKPHQTDR